MFIRTIFQNVSLLFLLSTVTPSKDQERKELEPKIEAKKIKA